MMADWQYRGGAPRKGTLVTESLAGVTLESVSMGKGLVHWRVNLPSLKKRPRTLEREYSRVEDACAAIKKHFTKDEVNAETTDLVERYDSKGEWRTSPS